VKPVGKPDAGNPPVRFDERGRETGRCRMAQATAPFLDSTNDSDAGKFRFGTGLHLEIVNDHDDDFIGRRLQLCADATALGRSSHRCML